MNELQPLMDWLALHPAWALVFVFLIAMFDALLVVGLLVPAIPLLFGVGALAALDAVEFWPCVIAAATGAMVGDGVSFFVGRWFGGDLFASRLAQRYPEAMARSRRFFDDHGKKSILFGRFFGIVRPLIPAVAGAYGMRPWVFVILDTIAGALWALAYLVPGLVFGASLGLASEVATRLATLLLLLLALVVFLSWAVNRAVILLQSRGEAWVALVLDWSHRHRVVGRLGGWLADPNQPETPALAAFALALLALGSLALSFWWGWDLPSPSTTDLYTYVLAQELQTPLTTALATAIAALADWTVYGPVAVAILVPLVLTGRTRAALHGLAALAFGVALTFGLYWLLETSDPAHYFSGEREARASGFDLIIATVVYAFVAVLLTTRRSQRVRVYYYGLTATLIALMLLAELYLGRVWLSIGIAAVVFGGVWITILGVGYRRHRADVIPTRELLPLALGVLVAAAALQGSADLRARDMAEEHAPLKLDAAAWWRGGYSQLPIYRVDAAGREKQPLTVQWTGDLAAIEAALRAGGWESPPGLSWLTGLRWLAISAPLTQLPLLPQVHAGAHQALMLRRAESESRQTVLRLWPSNIQVGRLPLWVGTLSDQQGHRTLRLVRYPRASRDYDSVLAALDPPPAGFESRRVVNRRRDADDTDWSGALWLLRPAPRDSASALAPR